MVEQSFARKSKYRSQYQDSSRYLLRNFNLEGHNITITFSLERELRWACKRTREKLDKVWWMKNLLAQWETKEENLKINLIKNLLTQWEIKEENQKTNENMLLINREYNGNVLLLDGKHSGNILLIDKNPQN